MTTPADRDLVGWATRTGDKLHLELGDRSVLDDLDQIYDCNKGRPPFAHYVIEIVGGRAEGRYPATMARSCPLRGPCTAVRAAVLTIESYGEQTGGGIGTIELTFKDGRIERDTIEYDYCYR